MPGRVVAAWVAEAADGWVVAAEDQWGEPVEEVAIPQ